MGFFKLIIISGMLLVLTDVLAPAQTNVQPEVTPQNNGSTDKPQIFLELLGSKDKLIVWRPLRLQVHIINGKKKIDIKEVAVRIPLGMGVTHPSGKDGVIPIYAENIQLVEDGQSWRSEVIELQKKNFLNMGYEFLSIMTYIPRDELFLATFKYRDSDDPEGSNYYEDKGLSLHINTHPLGMFLGAVLGALLIATLNILMTVRNGSYIDEHEENSTIRLTLGNFSLSVLTGVVASGIAILVFQSTSNIDFAIAVTVKDFYGGVLLGLFGEKVAQSIYNRIKNPDSNQEESQKPKRGKFQGEGQEEDTETIPMPLPDA